MHELKPLTGVAWLIFTLVKLLGVFTVVMVTVAMLTLLERKLSAWIQDRYGPNRVGPSGLLQPIADGIKNIIKEETFPSASSGIFFFLAPMMSIIPALVTFAVIPFAAPLPTPWGLVPMVVADIPIGILFILALSSLGVYGIVIAGWASNNKYAFLGGLRASAQMVSYEVALGMSLIPVFMLAGNVTLTQIVWTQQGVLHLWFALPLGLAFMLFVIAAFAETNRLPFDLAEAESELITGYHTEYSSMKFSMFFIAEYSNMLTASALMATLFLGGWDIPGGFDNMHMISASVVEGANPAVWKTLVTLAAFALKTFAFIFLFMWVRWTVPRFRYDQVMHLGWKIMLPTALAYIVVTGTTILVLDQMGVPTGLKYGLVLTAVNAVCTFIFVRLLDSDRIMSGSSPHIHRPMNTPAGVNVDRQTSRETRQAPQPRHQEV
jgi:NADH-quinone oxidoreductase subunit H